MKYFISNITFISYLYQIFLSDTIIFINILLYTQFNFKSFSTGTFTYLQNYSYKTHQYEYMYKPVYNICANYNICILIINNTRNNLHRNRIYTIFRLTNFHTTSSNSVHASSCMFILYLFKNKISVNLCSWRYVQQHKSKEPELKKATHYYNIYEYMIKI